MIFRYILCLLGWHDWVDWSYTHALDVIVDRPGVRFIQQCRVCRRFRSLVKGNQGQPVWRTGYHHYGGNG